MEATHLETTDLTMACIMPLFLNPCIPLLYISKIRGPTYFQPQTNKKEEGNGPT